MSVITDMLLVTKLDEREAVERLNAWCREHDDREQQFEPINTDAAGGYKVFTDEVWACSANHFPWSDLAAALPMFSWRWPHAVVLIVSWEFEDQTRVFRGDGLHLPVEVPVVFEDDDEGEPADD